MDLEDIANHAFERNDYAIAADVGRRIFKLMEFDKKKTLRKRIEKFATKISKLNNAYLQKNQCFADKHHRTLTYMIDKRLRPLRNQPDFVTNQSVYQLSGDFGRIGPEWMFMQTCQKGSWLSNEIQKRCRFLHHRNPYLKLGPFLEEQTSITPYSVVFHDFLTENEIQYLVIQAKPNLTISRSYDMVSGATNYQEIKSGKARRVIHKTVQAWISEVEWPTPLESSEDWVGKRYTKMLHPVLWKLNRKISLATQMVTDIHGSASMMQVTNYGLGMESNWN